MDDERQLNIEIAKLVGWRIEQLATGGYRLKGPQDESYGFPEKYAFDDESAHHIMALNIPEFTTDANAALTLFAELSHDWTPRLVRMLQARGDHMAVVWKAVILHNELHEQFEATEDTPALAIVRAWLLWQAKGAGG